MHFVFETSLVRIVIELFPAQLPLVTGSRGDRHVRETARVLDRRIQQTLKKGGNKHE